MKFSAFNLLKQALTGQTWPEQWSSPEPRAAYDAIIVGAGGHGLATAYYLATVHGITNVAVIEKSYIGSGNVGRNTTLIRSNYMIGGNTAFFEHSLKLWEGLSHELNFNCMVSQRGQIVLAVNPVQMDVFARRGNTMRLNGIDAELLARRAAGQRARMVLQVHDELIFELPRTELDDVREMATRLMPTLDLEVPLDIEMKVGKTWGELKK